jgi:hypothetical protein
VSSSASPTTDDRRRTSAGAADDGAQAGQHLLHSERLGQIIVGAGVDAFDALGPGAARGEHQHREVPAFAPRQRLSTVKTVHARQTKIEDGGGIGFGVAKKPCLPRHWLQLSTTKACCLECAW